MANNIKEVLEIVGMPQTQLAEKLNISKQSLHFTLESKNPQKYLEKITSILGIEEFYLVKNSLSKVDRLLIKKQYLIHTEKENVDEETNEEGGTTSISSFENQPQLEELEKELRQELLFEKIRKQIDTSNDGDFNYKMYELFIGFFDNPNSIEFSIIRDILYTLREDIAIGYMPNLLTREQRKGFKDDIAGLIRKYDEENKAKWKK